MRKGLRSSRPLLVFFALVATALLSGCGGGSGQPAQTVTGPTPTIKTLSPSSALTDERTMLTINGTKFVNGAMVIFNGMSHSATSVSSTQLTVWLSPSDVLKPGSYSVSVTNPGGGTSDSLNFTVIAFTTSGAQVPASFFAMQGADPSNDFPLQVSYGNFRNWASGQAWATINMCNTSSSACQSNPAANSSFNFDKLDSMLAALKTAGVNDILFTLSNTPKWAASSVPASETCVLPPAGCMLPPDINPDGSGTNKIWDNWVENLATHVNDKTWLQTHAHIKYWEPWNEVFSDLTISSCCLGGQSTVGTFAQNLRFTEDTRCLILGKGTIHNYPTAGLSTPCSAYLSSHGYSFIDASAEIVLSSMSPTEPQFVQNYLYCNDSPPPDMPGAAATSCNWSANRPWMSDAVDILNFHLYVTDEQPEDDLPSGSRNDWLSGIRNILSSSDLAKPLWNGEASCGVSPSVNPQHIWGDPRSMAAFVPRYAALLWSGGVAENFWFEYDTTIPTPYCPLWSGMGLSGNMLTPAGVAWNTTFNWLVGAKPAATPFCSNVGTVWTCPLTKANGKAAELVWDSQYGPGGTTAPANCSMAGNALICGHTSYPVPSTYGSDWVDIEGTVHSFQATVTIGAVPILLE